MSDLSQFTCPNMNIDTEERILLAHGEGGSLMRRLLFERILPRLGWKSTDPLDDAAVLPTLHGQPVLTTDAFVVTPLFFPGGDIGSLAVYGTVNDLVVRGAEPLWLTLSMVLEEGLPLVTLERVIESIAAAARHCGVAIVAGDTKVVPRGAADGMFLSTAGLGRLIEPAPTGAATIEAGDLLIVSGPVGQHGIAILSAREQLHFEPPPTSDCGPLTELVHALRVAGVRPRALRDATRGGVTAVLHEWARDSGKTLVIDETLVPVSDEVRGVCELLGLDPLSVANEGTMVIAVPSLDAKISLQALHRFEAGKQATLVGEVRARGVIPVIVKRILGRESPLIEPTGALLPRIC
jgi:hydrogenase expression/formation protein HypE